MDIAIYAIILPRLEILYLEEWIEHHINLGVTKIYLYNNGLKSVDHKKAHYFKPKTTGTWKKRSSLWQAIPLSKRKSMWRKKPMADYCEHLSDEEVMQGLKRIEEKFKEVTVVSWVYGEDHKVGYPKSQLRGIRNCIRRFPSTWWLLIDPDEYIFLAEDLTLPELINLFPKKNVFSFGQKIFRARSPGRKVREITEQTGCFTRHGCKKLIRCPHINNLGSIKNIHSVKVKGQKKVRVPLKVGSFYHYSNYFKKKFNFNDSMLKYLK